MSDKDGTFRNVKGLWYVKDGDTSLQQLILILQVYCDNETRTYACTQTPEEEFIGTNFLTLQTIQRRKSVEHLIKDVAS